MKTRKSTGRVISGLLLVQMVGLTVAFASSQSGVAKDYLGVAAGMETTMQKEVGSRQKAVGRRQKAEGSRQKAEGRRQ